MLVFVIKGNRKFYDIESMKQILKVQKSKIQRELKHLDAERVKYKNLHLYPERTLFKLMEIILVEKIKKENDKLV